MRQPGRLTVFVLSMVALALIFAIWNRSLASVESSASTIIFGTLVVLSFSVLLMEHWFTKPTDVLNSSIAVLLAILPSKESLSKAGIWLDVLAIYCGVVLILASTSMLLLQPEESRESRRNTVSAALKKIAITFGSSKVLFFALFLITAVSYVDTDSPAFLALMAYAALVLAVDPRALPGTLFKRTKETANQVGEIIGVQSRNTLIARLAKGRDAVRRYDVVEFADRTGRSNARRGLVIDNWVLNSQQWIKIVTGRLVSDALGKPTSSISPQDDKVYLVSSNETPEIIDRLVGTVFEGSNILTLKFDYGMRVPVREGTLLQVPVAGSNVLYQVTQGVTKIEPLEAKNEAGLIIGEASQIGTWNAETFTFDRFGWVPEINLPVLLAENVDPIEAPAGEICIGYIPDTNYPIFMDKQAAIGCHMAILGVTGTGKSVFARDLMRRLSHEGMKFVAIDFTGEYKTKLRGLAPTDIVDGETANRLFKCVDWVIDEMAKYQDKRDKENLAKADKLLREGFSKCIKQFLDGESHIAIFELPDVANTNSILSYTRWFFKVLFDIAREGKLEGKQICVVLEEAHTVIPEWNFVSSEDKGAQSLLNQIGQIALQGRKYGVGFMVIAQRTANVSKTVLTQCNTIIAFQQFDRTSGEFLANYMGQSMVVALQNLRPRQAIAVGKAFRNGLPTIFMVPDIEEEVPAEPLAENEVVPENGQPAGGEQTAE